jgi:hypothetical protein
MIIDVILDRKEGAIDYDAAKHLKAIYDYATDARMTDIATAVDGGNEADVRAALMRYITACGYPSALLDYIAGVRWTDDAPTAATSAAEKLALVRKVATRLRRNIKRERLAIVHDRRLGDINYLEAVEALTCGELGTEDPEPTEILLSVTYSAGLPAEKADAIEDALISAVHALPFSPDDIFRGTGDGTREYTALFTI